MAGTLGREVISTRQRKIAELAQREPKLTLTTLAHHVDDVWMREAYRRIRKDAAAGVDGVTAAQYEADLEANLSGLLERFKSGRYRAPAVRRVHLEKPGTSKTRPIGIPTLEDKILQRAVLMVMEPVYEQDFLDCSYGFRPGRGAHQALQSLWEGLMEFGGGWVIDLDIEDFFGSVDWGHLRSFLDQRVQDGVIRRAIGKWLNAGVMEAGELSYPQRGTPQGGVVSPTLSNVYLHEVLDQWFEHEVKPRLRGRAFEVRYADDAVLVFEHEDDARRVLVVLAKRLEKYGLRLHRDKTRMVEFCSPSKSQRGGSQRERSFVMLGFIHYWGRSRKGRWVVKRKTAKDRLSRALRGIGQWCRRNRHKSLPGQHAVLSRKLRGHYAYYGITGNAASLARFRHEVRRRWRKWLSRRGGRTRMTWERYVRVLSAFPLPAVQVVHSVYR